jgi:ABC-2 type transport system permease protein
MAAPTMPAPLADPVLARTPATLAQVFILARYQLRDFYRSRRFIILYAIVVAIGAIFSALIAHFRPAALIDTSAALYGTIWGGGVTFVIVLAAIFFGGDAIAGEFQNKTGYFLMGLPIRRAAVYSGKFIAAFIASLGAVVVYLAILLLNGVFYLGGNAFPWQLGASFLLAIVYLLSVLGATFLFSSLFKTSAYGIILTALLFLFGFSILQGVVSDFSTWEPWFVISYADSVIGNIFANPYPVHYAVVKMAFGPRTVTTVTWTPYIWEAVVIMVGYFLVTAIGGLLLFEREEFT